LLLPFPVVFRGGHRIGKGSQQSKCGSVERVMYASFPEKVASIYTVLRSNENAYRYLMPISFRWKLKDTWTVANERLLLQEMGEGSSEGETLDLTHPAASCPQWAVLK
jgi:hypothetical protein